MSTVYEYSRSTIGVQWAVYAHLPEELLTPLECRDEFIPLRQRAAHEDIYLGGRGGGEWGVRGGGCL
jgi:hypothetical protein